MSVSGASACSADSCPVIEAWSQSEIVLQRLLKKNVLILAGSSLNRDTCVENRELLVPLINLVGFLDDYHATMQAYLCE